MKTFIGNKFIKGITQFIQGEHFNENDFIEQNRATMGLSREEYMAYYMSENSKHIENFEQFSLNEENKSRSEGYIPAMIKREFEGLPANTEIYADALDYSGAAKDDLVVCYTNDDKMVRVPKAIIELQDGEGI
jgi:hypothetical protein